MPAPLPLVADGWMLTGKATSAAEELSPPPIIPPPPPPVPAPPPAALLAAAEGCPKGKSPTRLEKMGGKLENMFGVVSERTGVVSDSVVVVVPVVVREEVEGMLTATPPPPTGCVAAVRLT